MKMPADASRCERQQARGYVDLVLIRDSHYDKSPRPAYSLVPAGNWGIPLSLATPGSAGPDPSPPRAHSGFSPHEPVPMGFRVSRVKVGSPPSCPVQWRASSSTVKSWVFPTSTWRASERFRDEHHHADAVNYRRWQRGPKINRRYNSRWRKIRNAYITGHPLCEDCLAAERTTPAQEVHHVLPSTTAAPTTPTNLRALCKPCHPRQSALDDRWKTTPTVYNY